MDALVVSGASQRIERGAKLGGGIGRRKGLLVGRRLPSLDQREMSGIGNPLKCGDLNRPLGLSRFRGVTENQLPALGCLGRRDFGIGHDGDGLGRVLRAGRYAGRNKTGDGHDSRQKKTMHLLFPPEMTGTLV